MLEVGAFVFLILPGMLLSFMAAAGGGMGFVSGGTALIFRDLALVCLVLFFLWRNREPVRAVGWTSRHWPRELILGLVLFPAMFFLASIVERAALGAGLSPGPKTLPAVLAPHGAGEFVLATIMVVVVAISEETIFRGYLILRFRSFMPVTAALVLSSFVFSLGHGYEGSAGVVTVGFMGLVFAVVYWWRGSLVAPMVMHFCQDFLGIVILPLAGVR